MSGTAVAGLGRGRSFDSLRSEKLTRSSSDLIGVVVSGNGVICDDGDNDTAFELE